MNRSLINLARNYNHTVNEQAAGMKDSKSTAIMHIKRYLHKFFKRCESDIRSYLAMGWTGLKFQFQFRAEAADCLKSNLCTALSTHTTQQRTRAMTRTQKTQHLSPVYFNSCKSPISLVSLLKYLTYGRVRCVFSGFRHEADEICPLTGCYAAYSVNFLPAFPGNVAVAYSKVKKSRMGPTDRPETSVMNLPLYAT